MNAAVRVQVLGCSGSIAAGSRTTAFLLDDRVLIEPDVSTLGAISTKTRPRARSGFSPCPINDVIPPIEAPTRTGFSATSAMIEVKSATSASMP